MVKKKVKKGGSFWSDFKHGFSLPFQGIGELGSAALGGLLGNGRSKVPRINRQYVTAWNSNPSAASIGLVKGI